MHLRVFTSFSGYDSQCMALDRLQQAYPDRFSYDLVGWSEIDKYAIQAHNAVYPQWADRNYGDISKIDWHAVPDFDLFTYSSPCQDFSQAGLQRGGEQGSGTRSSLLWECQKAIEIKRPRYLLMENVAALVSKKFIRLFNRWQLTLEQYGYHNFAQVLNAKNYGVPQNRERIFMVSILDENARYEFPKPFPLTRRLKDVLEQIVDEKYYLSNAMIDCFENRTKIAKEKGNGFRFSPTNGDTIASSITTLAGNRTDDNFIQEPNINAAGELTGGVWIDCYNQSINTDKEGNARTINTHYQDMNEESVMSDSRDGYGYVRTAVKERKCHQQDAVQEDCGFRIRKLTEREAFRLMDVSESDIDKIQSAGISRTQQYKMAGNSIVVACLYHIFDRLCIHTEITNKTLFD